MTTTIYRINFVFLFVFCLFFETPGSGTGTGTAMEIQTESTDRPSIAPAAPVSLFERLAVEQLSRAAGETAVSAAQPRPEVRAALSQHQLQLQQAQQHKSGPATILHMPGSAKASRSESDPDGLGAWSRGSEASEGGDLGLEEEDFAYVTDKGEEVFR